MAPDPKCTAVANALKNSGKYFLRSSTVRKIIIAVGPTGLNYAQLASKIGASEQRVTDSQFIRLYHAVGMAYSLLLVCTGAATPTDAEFKALGVALNIADVRWIMSCPANEFCS